VATRFGGGVLDNRIQSEPGAWGGGGFTNDEELVADLLDSRQTSFTIGNANPFLSVRRRCPSEDVTHWLGVQSDVSGTPEVGSTLKPRCRRTPLMGEAHRVGRPRSSTSTSGTRPLATFDVPASPGNKTLSFLGVRFLDEAVARVRIRSGTSALGGDEKGGRDLVVMDDFIFGEPTP
jgi:hypothetical protein